METGNKNDFIKILKLKNAYRVFKDVSPLKISLDMSCKPPLDKFLKRVHNTHK